MNAGQPNPPDRVVAGDSDRPGRLQKRLRFQIIGGILVTALAIGGLASLQFYHSRQLSILDRLHQDVNIGSLALGARVREYQSIALQITSRSHIRDLLARYNRGDIGRAELRDETLPRLADAIRLSPSIVGIRRLDAGGSTVVEIGESLGDTELPATGTKPRLGVPSLGKDSARMNISANIVSADGRQIGCDIVAFDVSDSFPIIDRLGLRFGYPVSITFITDTGAVFDLQSPAVDRPAPALAGGELIAAIDKANEVMPDLFYYQGQYLAAAPVPNSDWRLLLIADSDDIMRDLRIDSAYLFAAILLLSAAGIVITSRLVKPTVGRIAVGEQQLETLYRRNRQLLDETLKNIRLIDDVLGHTTSLVFIKDLDGRYLHVNRAFCEERKLEFDQVIGKTDFDLHPPEVASELRARDQQAIEAGQPIVVEETLFIDDQPHYFITTKFPLRDQDDKLYACCGIATDATEIKKNEELRFALTRAEAANRAKTTFLANMSHELRTPLHGILSYADLGVSRIDSADKEKLKQFFDNIRVSGKRLLDLLNDLLDLSKLEAGKYELIYRKVSPGRVLDDCLQEFAPLAEARGVEIVRPRNYLSYSIECDLGKFQQVLTNLIGNAVEFSPRGGRISIEFGFYPLHEDPSGEGGFQVDITDDGGGIAEDELEQIFDKFYQSGKPRSGGTGLGLSICREIVLLHQGEISAGNCPGRGARFRVRIPRSNPSSAINEMRAV